MTPNDAVIPSEIMRHNPDGSLSVSLPKRFYEKSAVFSAAYKFKTRCLIHIEPDGEDRVMALFTATESGDDIEAIAKEYCQEALDQQHRLDLNRQFGHLRDLIVEHAFAPIANLKDRINGR